MIPGQAALLVFSREENWSHGRKAIKTAIATTKTALRLFRSWHIRPIISIAGADLGILRGGGGSGPEFFEGGGGGVGSRGPLH